VHDDVAGANFLSDFQNFWGLSGSNRGRGYSLGPGSGTRHSRRILFPKPLILAISPLRALFVAAAGRKGGQLLGQIGLAQQSLAHPAHPVGPRFQVSLAQRGWALRGVSVPGLVGLDQTARRTPSAQKSGQFGVVHAIVLRVNLPHKGLAGPDGAHPRILAAHQIQVVTGQQRIKLDLADPRQMGDAQCPVTLGTAMRLPGLHGPTRPTGANGYIDGLRPIGPSREPGGQ